MPPWAWVAVSGGLPLATAVVGLIRYKMRLDFLQHVYDKGKDRRDLEVAGKVSAPAWTVARRRDNRTPEAVAGDEFTAPTTLPNLHPLPTTDEKTPPAS